jgi:hypothetical protein
MGGHATKAAKMLTVVNLAFILIFGFITSLEDFYYNKIRNRWIIIAAIFGLALGIATPLFFGDSMPVQFSLPYFAEVLLNAGFALLFGYLLWYTGLWSAGDAKLFFAYALIVPLTAYNTFSSMHFPALTILVNTFVPFFIFYFVLVLAKSKNRFNWAFLKNILNLKLQMSLAVFVFGFAWPIVLLFSALKIPANIFTVIIGLFALVVISTRYLRTPLLPFAIALSLLRLVFDWKHVSSQGFLYEFILIFLVFLLTRFYLLSLSYDLFSKDVDVKKLKPGMIPAESVYKFGNFFSKRPLNYFSLLEAMMRKSEGKSVLSNIGDGLTAGDVRRLKRLLSEGKLKEPSIKVYHTLPFAPFMFVGALITIVYGMDVVVLIRLLIESFL